MAHDVEQVGRPVRVQQLGADRDPPCLLLRQPVDRHRPSVRANHVGVDRVSQSVTPRLPIALAAGLALVSAAPASTTQVGTWTSAPRLLDARAAHAVVVAGSSIVALGGTGTRGAPVMTVERFDGRAWKTEARLPVAGGLNATAAAAIGSRVYVLGGFAGTGNAPSAEVHVYDLATRAWSTAAPLPAPRGGHAAVALNGRIHVLGGGNSVSTLASHSVYDPKTNSWRNLAPLRRAKGSPAAVVLDGRIYAIGGRSGTSDFGDVDIYEPATDRWRRGPSIPPRGAAGAAVYGRLDLRRRRRVAVGRPHAPRDAAPSPRRTRLGEGGSDAHRPCLRACSDVPRCRLRRRRKPPDRLEPRLPGHVRRRAPHRPRPRALTTPLMPEAWPRCP